MIHRTTVERFAALEDFGFDARFCAVDDRELGALRVHYIDDGPRSGPLVLLLHGEPTWSYLFRHVIASLTSAGCRCVAVDLVGFGRSDKPLLRDAYSYRRQVQWMSDVVIRRLGLSDITLCCNDWGGLIGLRIVAEMPDRFRAVVATNTALPTGLERVPAEFMAWADVSQAMPDLRPSEVAQAVVCRRLTPGECRAYDAPFEDLPSATGLRAFPTLVPLDPDDLDAADNRAAWCALGRFRRPFATVFGANDPLMSHWQAILRDRVPGSRFAPHVTIDGAGMLVPEDAPDELAEVIVSVLRRAG